MKKLFSAIFFAVLCPVYMWSQVHLYDVNSPGVDLSGTTIVADVPEYTYGSGSSYSEVYDVDLRVVNTGANAIELKLRTTAIDSCSGSEISTIWVIHPAWALAGTLPVHESLFGHTIQPGDTVFDFGGNYRTSDTTCCARYLYEWYDVNNNDSVVANVFIHFDATHGACAVGVEEELKGGITIYPNPVNSSLTIDQLPRGVSKSIRIYNLIGECIINRQVGWREESIHLNTGSLNNGVYLVSVIYEGEAEYTQRIIVQH